jgi:hypothetical protein
MFCYIISCQQVCLVVVAAAVFVFVIKGYLIIALLALRDRRAEETLDTEG